MQFSFGDFARGFAESGSEQIAKTRARNEKLVNAGIERAMSRGTELWNERRNKAKTIQEWVAYVQQKKLTKTPAQEAYLASLPALAQENIRKAVTEAEALDQPVPDLFRDATAEQLAFEINTDTTINNALPASISTELTPDDENQVRDSFKNLFIRGSMAGGVIAPSPSYIQSRVMTEAAALMPEVDSAEQLRRLLSPEEVSPAADIGAELGFRMPFSVAERQAFTIQQEKLKDLLAPAESGQLYNPTSLDKVNNDLVNSNSIRIFNGSKIDALTNELILDASTIDKAATLAIGQRVGDTQAAMVNGLNEYPGNVSQSQRYDLVKNVLKVSEGVVATVEVNNYLRSVPGLTNTQEITKEDLIAVGAKPAEAERLATDVNTVRFGGTTRDEALQILAMMRNMGIVSGAVAGEETGREDILSPTNSKINLSQSALQGLAEYHRAIADGHITGLIDPRAIVEIFVNPQLRMGIEIPDIYGSLGDIMFPDETPADNVFGVL